MKHILFIVALAFSLPCLAQDDDGPNVSPAVQKQIRLDIEKEVNTIKPGIRKNNSAAYTEFYIDTLRVNRFVSRMLKEDYSNIGMQSIMYAGAKLYDSLLNKYYKKLSVLLKEDDKKALLKAQKAWLAFRDAENDLTDVISKDEYSGGGTMQGLVNADAYLDRIRKRVVELFQHYERTQPVE